jgi:hypothetical protein
MARAVRIGARREKLPIVTISIMDRLFGMEIETN